MYSVTCSKKLAAIPSFTCPYQTSQPDFAETDFDERSVVEPSARVPSIAAVLETVAVVVVAAAAFVETAPTHVDA